MRLLTGLFVLLTLLICPGIADATLVQIDFNDLATGDLAGQQGSTGFVAEDWAGSTNTDVVAGDLAAPVSTNFALTQSGTSQSLQGASADFADAAVQRNLATALNGTVWFSFLVKPSDVARSGFELDPGTGTATGGVRVITIGNKLYVHNGSTGSTASNAILSTTEASLIVGNVEINTSGNDVFSFWINPDVTDLGTPTFQVADRNFDTLNDGIQRLGLESYRSGGTAGNEGIVDLVTLSDGPNAYGDVTGVVPEPASFVLLLVGMASWFVWRRRR